MSKTIFFTRKQWNSWSTPSKLTALGTIITALSFIFYLGERINKTFLEASLSNSVLSTKPNPPMYLHGGFENSVNGYSIKISWVPFKNTDAVKLYKSLRPNINIHDDSTYDKVDYYNGIGVGIAVNSSSAIKYYYVATTVKNNIESEPTKEIMVDTSRIPSLRVPSVSIELTPKNFGFKKLSNEYVRIQWDGVNEVTKSYMVYLAKHPGINIRDKKSYDKRFSVSHNYFDLKISPTDVIYATLTPIVLGNEGYKSEEIKISEFKI